MNTANVAGKLSTTTAEIDPNVLRNTANVAGELSTSGSITAKVLAKRAEFLYDCEDVSLSGKANTYVLRWNKSDDMYMVSKRNLDGGSF